MSIEEQKQKAKEMNELLDHLIGLIESKDERYSFEWATGGVTTEMEIYDKANKKAYLLKISEFKEEE